MKRKIITVLGIILLAGAGFTYYFAFLRQPVGCEGQRPQVSRGRWTSVPSLSSGRSELSATAVDGKIYVVGGLQASATGAFERYDPAAESWEELPDLPVATHHMGMTAVNGIIYVTGGYYGLNLGRPVDAVWAFDPALGSWEAKQAMPNGRAAHGAVTLDGKIYLAGGVGIASELIWIYDPDLDDWEIIFQPMRQPREHLGVAAVGDEIITIGGRTTGAHNTMTVEIFDPATQSWRDGASMPTARGGLAAAILDNQIHIFGGEDIGEGCTHAQHEVYDVEQDRWQALDPMPSNRHGLTAAAVNGKIYVIGGAFEPAELTLITYTSQVEVFEP